MLYTHDVGGSIPSRPTWKEVMTQEDLNKVRWKTELCPSGEKCWCRIITTEVPVIDEDGNKLYIAASGCVPTENAEYIVRIHNERLQHG
jgi:hypothetical protein